MKLAKSRMKQIIKEEVDNLKQEGMFDFLKKEKPPIDFRPDDYYKREKLQLDLDKEQKKRLDLAVQTTQQFLDQELSDAQRLEGFQKLRRMLGSLLDPGTDLDRVIKNILREDLLGSLEIENNFIKKNNLEENEEYEETSEVSDSELEQMVATWNTSINRDGNPQWKKRHDIRSAHIVPDQAAGKWNWVVFEFTRDGEEDDIAQGTAVSFREAILAAEEALASGGQQYEIN